VFIVGDRPDGGRLGRGGGLHGEGIHDVEGVAGVFVVFGFEKIEHGGKEERGVVVTEPDVKALQGAGGGGGGEAVCG